MIAVVTGSSGFIGSHLVDALVERGGTVRRLLREESPEQANSWRVNLLDAQAVKDCPIWDGATHIFHVGGVTKRRTLAEFRTGNVVPTANILAAAVERAPALQRFVLVSSQTAAGPALRPDRPVVESDFPNPVEAYGQSKLEAERVALRYAESLPIVILRASAVYGPRDVDFLNIFEQALGPIAVYAAPREQVMSIVHVHDLVRAILLAADLPAARGRTYFVGSETPVSWGLLYATIAQLGGTHPTELQLPALILRMAGWGGDAVTLLTGQPVLVNSNKVALARQPWWLCDSSRIRTELGWNNVVTVQAGLRETYLWYVQAGWLRRGRAPNHSATSRRSESESVDPG